MRFVIIRVPIRVGTVLDSVSLIDLTRGDLLTAGTHARSSDAIHLAVALRVGADEIVTYDAELAERVIAAGLRALTGVIGDDSRIRYSQQTISLGAAVSTLMARLDKPYSLKDVRDVAPTLHRTT